MATIGDEVRQQLQTLEARFDRLDGKVDGLTGRVDSLDKRVDSLDKRVDSLDKRVDGLDRKVDELANGTKIQFGQVREDLKTLGQGYEDGLKSISRQIQALDKKWTGRFSTYDLALKDHARRIGALERRDSGDR